MALRIRVNCGVGHDKPIPEVRRAPIVEDNTGGDPAGPDMCGEAYERLDGSFDYDYPCILEPMHDGDHEDADGQVWM